MFTFFSFVDVVLVLVLQLAVRNCCPVMICTCMYVVHECIFPTPLTTESLLKSAESSEKGEQERFGPLTQRLIAVSTTVHVTDVQVHPKCSLSLCSVLDCFVLWYIVLRFPYIFSYL